MSADLEGSAAGGFFCQRRRLEPSGISATSSTSHLPPSLRPFTLRPSFSTTPDTCITSLVMRVGASETLDCPTGQLCTSCQGLAAASAKHVALRICVV